MFFPSDFGLSASLNLNAQHVNNMLMTTNLGLYCGIGAEVKLTRDTTFRSLRR